MCDGRFSYVDRLANPDRDGRGPSTWMVSVLVVVVAVCCVAVTVVDVIRVVAVLDGFVGAVRSAMGVVAHGVLGRLVVLVIVVIVLGVAVTIMQVVDVVAVLDRLVRAVGGAVRVLVEGVLGRDLGGHDGLLCAVFLMAAPGDAFVAVIRCRGCLDRVGDRIIDDVRDVLIGQRVDRFAP